MRHLAPGELETAAADDDVEPVGQPAVDEGLVEAHIRIVKTRVLADEADLDDVLRVLEPVDHGFSE